MTVPRALHRGCERRRPEQSVGEAMLIRDRQADDGCLLHDPGRGVPRGGHDEIAQASALDLRRALKERVGVGGQPRFKGAPLRWLPP